MKLSEEIVKAKMCFDKFDVLFQSYEQKPSQYSPLQINLSYFHSTIFVEDIWKKLQLTFLIHAIYRQMEFVRNVSHHKQNYKEIEIPSWEYSPKLFKPFSKRSIFKNSHIIFYSIMQNIWK